MVAAPFERRMWGNGLALAAADVLSVITAVMLAYALRVALYGVMSMPTWLPALAVLWVISGALNGLYPGWGVGTVDEFRRVSRSAALAVILTLAGAALAGVWGDASRFVLILAAGVAVPISLVARHAIHAWLVRLQRWGVPVAVYGTTAAVRRVIRLLKDQPHVGLDPVAAFDDDPRAWGTELDGVPVVGETHLVTPAAPTAVLAVSNGDLLPKAVSGVLRYYRRVMVLSGLVEHSTLVSRAVDVGGLLALEFRIILASAPARFAKRMLDLALVVAAMPVWLPVVSVSALVVWLEDRDNPLFAQARIGRGGRAITVLKLRTMRPDAEAVLEQALVHDPELRAEWETACKLRRDPRVTRVGRLLRRFSIDELPQLFNVLRGDMALVGPRPLPAYHEERLDSEARDLRAHVRPGVTGLWQVSGRSDSGDDAMEWLDGYYVRNWSLWLDLTVLVRTTVVAIRGTGAY
jgi:Undecaprenyl-phosphate galactose phosphotransferase WbaP